MIKASTRKQIDFVLDADPNKQGLYMPGSSVPIRPVTDLLEQHVLLCLLGVNPANQAKVLEKNGPFLRLGGEFLSIFPSRSSADVPVSSEGGVLCR